jgi:predicted ATPase/HPt (histidine-containing phosphotransfer) domain-containing protein
MRLPGYRLGTQLSRSERTAVYRAVRELDGRPVIIKTLAREYPLPSEVRRLEFEYRMLDKVRGPHVIEVLGLARTGGQLALILEDFGARSLAEQGLPLTIGDFFRVARQATLALGHVHGLDVVHKDIKPRNLVVNADFSRIKLIDLQLSCEISRERQDVSVIDQLQSSLPYASPEQTGRMNRALDYRSDYYSLGVTFFELLVGELPFSASDALGWVHCHLSQEAPNARQRAPSVPIMLSKLVAKLLCKEPGERYQSARGLLADLERCEALVREGRGAETFALGANDVSERFVVSQQLVGRSDEIRFVTGLFDAACQGPGMLLITSGDSGVGKSSVIRELQKPVTSRRGYFAAGKFGQLEHGVPYAGLALALRDLVRQLLTESDAQLAAHRQQILARLGATAGVMTELLPELADIIGPQPSPPPLDPRAAQNRFKLAFARCIEGIASPQHPLVLFIDDLQWADASTLELIADLFMNHELAHLLIVGAYRDNEVSSAHRSRPALRRLHEAAPSRVRELSLRPLHERGVAELVAGALRCTPSDCAALAREIFEKTGGNPFFASELLSTLYRRGAVSFSAQAGHWVCDLESARTLAAIQSVDELLLTRLEQLAKDARIALETAACVGNMFTLSTLSSLLTRTPDATALLLRDALAEGLIVPLDDSYKLMQQGGSERASHAALEVRYLFQHDRVQQAAYSLIADLDKAAAHLSIGRRLLAAEPDPEHAADVFSPTHHLNLGRRLMTSVSERELLAKLNRKAGAKALAATAFSLAAHYHEAGASALTEEEWSDRPELRFALFSERVGSVLMAGERERAWALCDDLFGVAPTQAARAAVYLMKSQVAMYRGRLVPAIDAVRQGLRLLGVEYPDAPAQIEQAIGAGIGRLQAHLARVPIDKLFQLPECTDAEKIVALCLLFQIAAPAMKVNAPLFVLAELIAFDLALTHGTTAVSAKNFVDVAMIQGAVLGDHAAAYRLGKVAFRLLERYEARALAGQVHFVFAAYVSPWGAPYVEALHSFEESRRLTLDAGDHHHFGCSEASRLRLRLSLGQHLTECDASARAAATLLDRIAASAPATGVRLCQLAIDQLRTPDDPSARAADAERLGRDIVAGGDAEYAFQHGQIQMLVNVLLGDWDAALRWSDFTRAWLTAASTWLVVPEYCLLECLLTTQCRWSKAADADRPNLLAELERDLDRLRRWRDGCPENFSHKYLLAAAEVARVKGESAGAVVALYDQAIEATQQQFLHLRALGSELFGQFLLGLGRGRLAEPVLRDGLSLYARWGALSKVHRLKGELERYFPHSRDHRAVGFAPTRLEVGSLFDRGVQRDAIELTSVLEANRAISAEVKSERLFVALMSAVLENAAAQHGCLLLSDDTEQRLYVRARADQSSSEPDARLRRRLEDEPRVCQQVVRFVARSLESLVIDDAAADPTFATDSYVVESSVKSVLCMPIVNQGRLVAILYLENAATTHAFTRDRVEVLRLIAAQAAVSITNASLYEELERAVEERTRELTAKTRKIAAMLDCIGQGMFTLDEQLTIQPEYSPYLERLAGRRNLVGCGVTEVLFEGSDLDAAVIAANEAGLRSGMGSPSAIANLNTGHLIKAWSRRGPDGTRRHYEVDWNWIVGDDGKVERVLVAARDVTVLRGLQQAAEAAAHETEVVDQILDAGLEDFKSFCETSLILIDRHVAAATGGAFRAERRQASFRDVHTIKSHARTLGLNPIVAAAHRAEEDWAAPPSPARDAAAIRALGDLASVIREYEQIGARKLGRLWGGADARFKQALGAIESALAQTPERPSYPARALTQVKQAVHRLNAIPLDQVLRETSRVFPSLARELGKTVPEIEWVDDGTLLDAEWGRVMKDALLHTFRNALDHGIETREERAAHGKAPRGKIALFTVRDAYGVRIHLRDDGRGLPIAELRTKTGRLDSPDHAVAEAIFDYAMSTARQESHVSGRGIGMDAVRGFLRERGGDVAIEFTGDTHAGYRPFELVFRLPSDAMIAP